MVNITNILIDVRRGSGSPTEILYGTVTFKPTLAHSRSTSLVLPAPTTYDLVSGQVVATNVQPTPAPVEGQIEWAYEVTFKDRHSKTYSFLVGVPDSTTQVNFTSLPRYFETKPPLFGQGPKGEPGEAATVAVGTVTGGATAQVSNSGTNTDAVLDFVLPQGPQGPKGDGIELRDTLVTDLPDSYIAGTTYGNVSSAAGWPVGFALVVTERRFSGRVTQTITSSTRQLVRNASSNTWLEWREIPTNAVATPSANGLMSSADKARLDDLGTLPIRSKLVGDTAQSYPQGSTVAVVSANDGWPQTDVSSELSILRTDKPKGYSVAIQYLSPYNSTSVGDSIDDPAVLYRIGTSGGRWSEFKRIASEEALGRVASEKISKGELYVDAADYGAVGDGVNNDYWAIQRAINAAAGRPVRLRGGRDYRCAGTLTVPTNSSEVSLIGEGKLPARLILGADGQSYPAIDFNSGEAVTVKILTKSVGMNSRSWEVDNTSGLVAGMLCEVVSSAPWYHDPRPEAAPLDSRKSELHRVKRISGNLVYFDDTAFDGYDVSQETVQLRFYSPIYVHLENLTVVGTLPAVGAETKATQGIVVSGGSEPTLINVSAENCARTGVGVYRSYRPTVRGGYSRRSNNFYNGYGLAINGCSHALVEDRHTYESKKGVDVTGFNCVSRNTVIQNCKTIGGGQNSRGENYGWNPDGTAGAHQAGFGSHGGVEDVTYRNNYTRDLQDPYNPSGRNTYVENNIHFGRTLGGFVQGTTGINLYVTNNKVIAGYWGIKGTDTFGAGPIDAMRADTLVTIFGNWQSNPASGIRRGQLVISGNEADLRVAGLRMHLLHRGEIYLANNRFNFIDANLPKTCYLIDNNSGVNPTTGEASQWTIGPNDVRTPGNVVTALTSNRTIAGAKVMDYTTAT